MLSNSDNATVGAVSGFSTEAGGFNTYLQARGFAANGPAYNLLFNPIGGNVGIGTTIPTQRLTIDGNITTVQDGQRILFPHSNALDFNDGSIGSGLFEEGLNIVGTQTVAGNGRRITTIGDVVNQNRVGIGNVAPTSFLDVNGDARVRNIPAGAATDVVVTADANGNLRQRTAAQIVADGGGNDNLYTSDGTIAGNFINRQIFLENNRNKIVIRPSSEATTPINGNIFSTFNVIGGNINSGKSDIGITLANTSLDNTAKYGIIRASRYDNRFPVTMLESEATSTEHNLFIGGSSNNGAGSANPAPTKIQFNLASSTDISLTTTVPVITAMTMLGGTGNVGIGTATPRAGLEISKTPTIGATIRPLSEAVDATTSGNYNLVMSNSDNGTIGTVSGFFNDINGFHTYFQARGLAANGLPYNMLLNPLGGRIGIGTNNPNKTLDINGELSIADGGLNASSTDTAADQITFSGRGVSGQFKHTIRTVHSGAAGGNNIIAFKLHQAAGAAGANNQPTVGALTLTGAGPNGRVGIGNIEQPTEALDVNGNIRATGNIIVQSAGSNLPDYVFEKYFNGVSALNPTYKMMSLDEIETFTKANNHLPGVQNVNQVKENGLLVNELTRTNLEKVEELFLHTIKQEKKIKTLENENKELKSRLDKIEAFMLEQKSK